LTWLLDASVLLAAEDDQDPQYEAARRLQNVDTPLMTLDLAFYETANVTMRVWRDPAAGHKVRAAVGAFADAGRLYRVDEGLAAEAATIAEAYGITARDAAYAAAAQTIGARLVSCDLREAAPATRP